jgi:polyisoprenoid-binding protein YceI
VVDATGAIRYQIDGAASTLHILVYRGGAMARLGHNHVVSSENVSGTLLLRSELRLSRLDLTLPVATMVVDDPVARALEGGEFADEVPRDAREGTRQNLLRAEVLDAEHYPEITLQSVAVSGTRSSASLIMQIAIKGVSRDIPVLAAVREDGNLLIAEGEFAIRQTDFGIAPFSVALGALQVQDQLRIKFTIVARRQQ